jgi:hypothetical protein
LQRSEPLRADIVGYAWEATLIEAWRHGLEALASAADSALPAM